MPLSEDALAFMAKVNKVLPGHAVLASDIVVPKRFTSGSLALDVALGGGFPANLWTEIIGKQSMGKTATIFKTIAANQALDPSFTTFWLAAEHYDTEQAAALGVDNSRVTVVPTRKMELGLDLILDATESKAFDCVVCDSYPALLPEEEEDKAMNEAVIATGAKLFNKFWRKMGEAAHRNLLGGERPFLGLMVNQWRDNIGAWSPRGVAQTSPGGHGKDFSYYTRVDLTRVDWLTEKRPNIKEPVKVGQTIKYKTIKNKSAAPQQTAEVDFYFRPAPLSGFHRGDYDTGKEMVTMGILFRVIERAGNTYSFGGQKWVGLPATQAAFREDVGLQEQLSKLVLEVAADPALANAVLDADIAAAAASGPRRTIRKAAK